MEQQMEFFSRDFYLSACILASGIPLKRLERIDGKTVIFVFDDPQNKANHIITAHWDKTLNLPTRDFVEAINELKTRIHSGV